MARNSDRDLREKSTKLSPLRSLVPFIFPYRKLLFLAILALITTASLSLILPMAVRRVVDSFSTGSLELMDLYFASAVGIAALLGVGTAVRFYLVSRLGERVVTDIRNAVYERVITMSPTFFENILTGEVLSRLTTDTTLIQSVIGSSVSIALRNVLLLFGGLILMMFTSVKLTLMVLLVVPLVLIPILTLGRRLRDLSRVSQDRIAESSGQASEMLLAAQTVQAYTHENVAIKSYTGLTEKAFSASLARIKTRSFMTAIVIFLVFTCIVGVLWIGARDVREGVMSSGQLVQFVIYSVLVAGAVAALSEIWGELQRAAGATERLVELLQLEDPIKDPENPAQLPERIQGGIAFKNVTFCYPARPKIKALDGFDLSIKPGETIALVGPSGAGKSTVFQLLLRFFEPNSGEVSVDGFEVGKLNKQDLRSNFALVPQDPVIFATSALENIRFGRQSASDEEIEAAAKAAAAHEFLIKLPEGYNSYVGERGVMLSGGQKQRIAIARAVLHDAPILLLDEATSALDAESERAVQTAVESLSKDRTTLIIAHRLATVKKADRIVVMEDGKIVATGTHDDLVAQGGLYARLARLQFTDLIFAAKRLPNTSPSSIL